MFAVALDVATRTDGFVVDEYNGRLLSATRLLDMGIVDVVAPDGRGGVAARFSSALISTGPRYRRENDRACAPSRSA